MFCIEYYSTWTLSRESQKKTREFRKFFVWLCFKHVLSLLVLSSLKTQISEIKSKKSLNKRFEVAF